MCVVVVVATSCDVQEDILLRAVWHQYQKISISADSYTSKTWGASSVRPSWTPLAFIRSVDGYIFLPHLYPGALIFRGSAKEIESQDR